jgi:hypothetical protein
VPSNSCFDSLIRRTSDSKFPPGCFITNTSCPASGDEITRRMPEAIGQQEFAIYHVLRPLKLKVR